ncbi:arginine exporter protein ArgO [Kitasatospora sp. GP30]|uniref:LysE/ArgO family amino acid transporter n=1 Tax=Kitasatospora sp. GP30 TaxID=3035084 RepID=UPI000C700F86|nr:LysE family transporter [Kitasatospora sp. GP30]MDH6145017.1 arginine exporter protein ArgO [Kitasatospora sp. GP30]
MSAAVLAGLLAGYGIAVPVGAIGALLVGLSARRGWRIGAGAALGVATADGVYAAVAVLGGQSAARFLAPASTPLRWAAGVVLLGIAARTALAALKVRQRRTADKGPQLVAGSAVRAYAALLGLTLLNPATVIYFVALVLGGSARHQAGPVFVIAAFLASASWQLLLAVGGALLGRGLTGERGRLVTALLASALITALAVRSLPLR